MGPRVREISHLVWSTGLAGNERAFRVAGNEKFDFATMQGAKMQVSNLVHGAI